MQKKLTWAGKLLYASSSAGWSMLDRIVVTWLMYYYTAGEQPLLLPALFGAVMVFGRIVDAVADPLVALWSDNHRGRLGRRTPFLLYGALFYTAVYVALFYPPSASHGPANLFYLAAMGGLYYFFFTVYVCPYLALLPELVRKESDRVDLSTLRAAFSLLGVAAALVGSGVLINRLGFGGMIWCSAAAGIILLYLPVFVREKEYVTGEPASLGLRDAIMTTLRNRAFRYYLAGNTTFWLGFNIVTVSLPFYVTVLLGQGEEMVSYYFAAAFVVAFLLFPAVNILAKKMGQRLVMLVSLFFFTVLLPLFYFLGQPLAGLSAQTAALILMAVAGIPLATLFVLPDAIVAAITDLEAGLSGQQRQAMYFGTQGLILKMVLGLSTLVTGVLFQVFGNTAAEPLGVKLTGPIAGVFVLAGCIFFYFYPEKEVRAGAAE
ncbi:MAG TPA: MFS transporter [Firmicutes bacterium]|nr:MFS transporter [Bacillota bacterium]